MNNTFGSALLNTAAALSLTCVSLAGTVPGATGPGAIGPGAIGPGAIGIGDLARYTWRAPLVNGLGVTSLEDLRGKPVLIDFWGVR